MMRREKVLGDSWLVVKRCQKTVTKNGLQEKEGLGPKVGRPGVPKSRHGRHVPALAGGGGSEVRRGEGDEESFRGAREIAFFWKIAKKMFHRSRKRA